MPPTDPVIRRPSSETGEGMFDGAHLSKEFLKKVRRQNVPCDGIGDGCEDPVKLSEWTLAFLRQSGDRIQQIWCHFAFDRNTALKQPTQRNL